MSERVLLVLVAIALSIACGCASSPRRAATTPVLGEPSEPKTGDEIVICGKRISIGAPVVLWTQTPAYDAYSLEPRFAPPVTDAAERVRRYDPGRLKKRSRRNLDYVPPPPLNEPDDRTDAQKRETIPLDPIVLLPPDCGEPVRLARHVDQLVLHYDACGLSRTCFRVLQDERHLSVHFLLDVDGTIYQTLDLRETAWHATKANGRSIGVEIANVGAFSPEGRDARLLDEWYGSDAAGPLLTIPARVRESGIRTQGFVGRPRNPQLVRGTIQGHELVQRDFTPEQYESLAKLAAALCRELPRIEPDAPRDADGKVIDRALDPEAFERFRGILGHHHVQTNKTDPGPAFDWERFLADVRARLAQDSM